MQPSFNHDDMLMKPYLEHHGILGQKWGIRRFQNKDGSLTAEGKKRYGTGNGRHTRSNRSAKSAISSDPTLSAMDKDYLGANSLRKSPEDATAAANLGLKALVKTRPHDNLDPDDKFDQDWFLNEDQTFGLPTAANFVNKGYSAEDIKKFFKAVNENADYDSDDYSNYFDVMESGYSHNPGKIDEFIDECVSIRDGGKAQDKAKEKEIDKIIASNEKELSRLDIEYGKLQEKAWDAWQRGDKDKYNEYEAQKEAINRKTDEHKRNISNAILPYLGKEDTPGNRLNMIYEYNQKKKHK